MSVRIRLKLMGIIIINYCVVSPKCKDDLFDLFTGGVIAA